MSKIKIAQIGVCHEHASGKMEALRELNDLFDVVGFVNDSDSQSPKRMNADQRAYQGLPQLSLEEVLSMSGLQAVTVETPNAELVPVATKAMHHNLSIHMDKPGGEDITAFNALVHGCQDRGLIFQMGYMLRNNQAIQMCLKAARAGWLGDILSVHGSMSHDYGGETYQTYMEQVNGGIMYNLGCHLIDFVVALLGRPDAVTPTLKALSGYKPTTQNNCACVLAYPHAIAILHACSKEVNGLDQRHLKVCGTKGTFEIRPLERFDGQPLTMRLILRDGNTEFSAGDHSITLDIKHHRYIDQIREFAHCINGDIIAPYSATHDLTVQEVVLAASNIHPTPPCTTETV